MHRVRMLAAALFVGIWVTGCSEGPSQSGKAVTSSPSKPASAKVSRWYGPERVERGAKVFAANCAICHGKKANGYFSWQTRGPDGKFPPPPLNGTGHAWHHPLNALVTQVKFGAQNEQGKMPGFGQVLTDEEILDAIAWFQDLWSDELYARAN